MATLTAEQILAADDLGLLRLEVPEWKPAGWKEADGMPEVYCRVMSVGERDSYERLWIGKRETGIENFRTEYLARVLCDDKGNRLFNRDQIEQFAQKSGSVMGRLFDAAMKHNHMSEGDVEQLGKS
jgi:hypothetical protein